MIHDDIAFVEYKHLTGTRDILLSPHTTNKIIQPLDWQHDPRQYIAQRMSRTTIIVLVAVLLVLALAQPAQAFGAGNIPSFAYLEGKGESSRTSGKVGVSRS